MFTQKPIDISGIRHLYPFQSRFMDIGGLQYHYIDEGRGEPLRQGSQGLERFCVFIIKMNFSKSKGVVTNNDAP